MATIAPVVEEATRALPLPIIKSSRMNVILAVEIRFEASELNSLWFFRIPLSFCDFADHA
ncbi:hypothetical protein [Ktedonosporobacter rubrisoli]|uniref:hypothetical protein n=1 Tax=Ktedonosporobacter rubrisoli TaxID=2509675 RepID=UPI0013EE8DCF|nr:hypothetical protein [Ktedonosporobacter rubrisoli]